MGARSLETVLRGRVLAFVGPALLAVALASLAITSRALDVVDANAARDRSNAALRMLRAERDEGDDVDVAIREVTHAADADGVRLVMRVSGATREQPTAWPLPSSLRSLGDGSCAYAQDDEGRHWRGCAVADGNALAIAAIPVDAHRVALRTVGAWTLAIVLLALLGIAIAVRYAVRGPLASLRALAAWSQEVGASDDVPPPPRASDTAEIARLGASFDDLVRRLLDALLRARANSAHIAHELRTPLTAIRGELEGMSARGDATSRDAVARVLGDVDRLTHAIDAILVLSNPETGTRAETVVNLADVARELSPKETRVEAPDEALIEGDARLVHLAVRNLLDNATKYSGHAATTVRVSRDGALVTLAVLDDGAGLDADARAKMFDRYWRGAQGGEGSGLGLALVRAVAERHGGRASARPNPGGRGLEVSVSFGHVVGWHD